MSGGRQNLYRSDYCELVKEFNTITAFARHIGVVFQTVYLWTHKHPEFAEAVKAMTRSLPTLYRADYCDAVVDCLKDVYDWMARHPEFADAVKRAQAKSALWWERRILDLAQNDRGNARAVIFGLKNRASEHWRDSNHAQMGGMFEPIHRIEHVIVRPERSEGEAASGA